MNIKLPFFISLYIVCSTMYWEISFITDCSIYHSEEWVVSGTIYLTIPQISPLWLVVGSWYNKRWTPWQQLCLWAWLMTLSFLENAVYQPINSDSILKSSRAITRLQKQNGECCSSVMWIWSLRGMYTIVLLLFLLSPCHKSQIRTRVGHYLSNNSFELI